MVLAISVTPVSGSAQSCRSVLSPLEREGEALQANKDLNNLYYSFEQFLFGKQGETLKQSEMQEWIDKINAQAEKYFKSAGIQFQKKSVVEENISTTVNIPSLKYDFYVITSAKGNSENANFINGILNHKKLLGVKLIYDPFLRLRRPSAQAMYVDFERAIYFDHVGFLGRMLGWADLIRHEVQHALEHSKLRSGLKTLASFQLYNRDPKEKDPYAERLSADELETHLRDYRFVVRLASRKDIFLTRGREESTFEMRKVLRNEYGERLFKLIKKVRKTLASLKNLSIEWTSEENGIWTVNFATANNPYYPIVIFDIKAQSKDEAEAKVAENIRWALNRIKQIEREALELKKLSSQAPM